MPALFNVFSPAHMIGWPGRRPTRRRRRNVEELEKLGVIVHSHLGHGPATYHLAEGAHSHFVCEVCGKTFEAPDALFRSLSKTAKAQFGFDINPHHFAVFGRCRACQ